MALSESRAVWEHEAREENRATPPTGAPLFFFFFLSVCPTVLMEEFRASREQTSVLPLIYDCYSGVNLYLSHVGGFPRVPLEGTICQGCKLLPA